ncbi:putative signaling protein [Thauera aminoaromatica S2]|uniref:Putative signaling protein n=1 Tax=Thauera aminoaromatica S2 TaxID=1234381 RepID=N6YVX2_THASP|nr:putative signaling protein [Thauera aminoaromatica S2]
MVGDWFGCELSSVFQPIVIPGTGAITGYEAYLRILGSGERSLSPWTLFSANADDDRLIALDRLARTAHALNFVTSVDRDSLLFLNVHGRLLAAVSGDHGAAFRKVVDALGLAPERIVIETPLAASSQPELLAFVLRNYRNNGFQVAINVDSPMQWQALSSLVPAQFVKIDSARLFIADDWRARLEWLATLRERADIVVTRLERKLDGALPEGVHLQGHAYGLPAQRAAIMRAERHVLDRFAF